MSILPPYGGAVYVGPGFWKLGSCRDRRFEENVGWGSKNVDFQKCLGVFLPGRGSPDEHLLTLILLKY